MAVSDNSPMNIDELAENVIWPALREFGEEIHQDFLKNLHYRTIHITDRRGDRYYEIEPDGG